MWQLVLVVTGFLATQVRQPIQWSSLAAPFQRCWSGGGSGSVWLQVEGPNSTQTDQKDPKGGPFMGWTSSRCREADHGSMVAQWPIDLTDLSLIAPPDPKWSIRSEAWGDQETDGWVPKHSGFGSLSYMRTKIETILSLKPRTKQNFVLQRKFEFGLAFHKINLLYSCHLKTPLGFHCFGHTIMVTWSHETTENHIRNVQVVPAMRVYWCNVM